MEAIGMFLAHSVLVTILIEVATVDVQFEFDKSCYNEGDSPVLTATYTGAATEQLVHWFYEDKVSDDNTIDKDTCDYDIGGADQGYPAMTYNCDDSAQHKYTATITSLPKTAIGKNWGASFTLTGGTNTGYKKQTLNQCTSNDSDGLTQKQKLGIGLGVGIPAGIGLIALIVFVAYKLIK